MMRCACLVVGRVVMGCMDSISNHWKNIPGIMRAFIPIQALVVASSAWGSAWTNLGSGLNDGVNALADDGVRLYAGGTFTNAGAVGVNHIAQWDGMAWSALGAGIGGEWDSVLVLKPVGNILYAGGMFNNVGDLAANNIAAWDGTAWTNLGDGLGGIVWALAHDGTNLYASGDFQTAGGVEANYIAMWNGTAWTNLGSGMDMFVHALACDGSHLYAGGYFTNAGGVAATNMAKWNGTAWSAVGAGLEYEVTTLAYDGSRLYAGCYTTNIFKWDGASWSVAASIDDGYVATLLADGPNLYAGGNFTNLNGLGANYIAAWNGAAWTTLGEGMDNQVMALAVEGSNLYAGGWFTVADGNPADHVAMRTALPSDGAISLSVTALQFTATYGGAAYVDQLVTISNSGDARIEFQLTAQQNPSAPFFAWSPTNGVLAAGASMVCTARAATVFIQPGVHHGTTVVHAAWATNPVESLPVTFDYRRATNTITFLSPIRNPSFGSSVSLLALGRSTNPVTFTVVSGPAVFDGTDKLTFTSTGVVTITANQAGDAHYEDAPEATNTFTVRRGYDPITLSNLSQAYDGTPKPVTAVSLHTNPVTVTYNGVTNVPSALGSYTVTGVVDTALWQGTQRGTLTIAKMPQTISNFLPAADSLFLTNDLVRLSAQGGGSGSPVVFTLAPGSVGILSGGTNLSFSGPGTVIVYANQASNDFYEAAPTVAHTFYIYPNIAYVATSGNDANNGRTWATAKRTIQAGVDIGRPGGAVWVSNGVYNTGGVVLGGATNRVAITNNIDVRSVNGPAFTTIMGGDQIRPVGIETGLLAGFTLTNGVVTNAWGGGAWGLNAESAVITNCHINGNQAVSGGAVAACKVYNSELCGNYAMDSGGGAIVSHLVRCNITGNRAGRNGGGVRWSTADNCIIMNNAAIGLSGGGVCEGVANGCLIAGNSAGFFGGAAVYTPLNNCTIYANNTGVSAGSLTNCIAWGNGIGDVYGLEKCPVRNSCLGFVNNYYRDFGVRNGVDGNIIGDPLFMDAASGDFRLQAASPCINAGDNALVPTNLVTDLADYPRISGGRVDMGAYELPLNEYYVAKNGQTPVSPYGAWSNAALNIEDAVTASGLKNDRVFHIGQGPYTTPYTLVADNQAGNGDPGHLTLMPAGVVASSGLSLLGTNQSFVAFRGTRSDTQVVSRIALNQVKSSLKARAEKRPIVAGGQHIMAFKFDGFVVAWGSNEDGQCIIPANQSFIAIQANANASAGLTAQGSIVVWGAPAMIPAPSPNAGFADIFGGADASCMIGLKTDGSLVVWGYPLAGQENVPAPNSGFASASVGYLHCLGLKGDGTVVGWGNNGYGQSDVPAPNSGFIAVAAGGTHSLGLKAAGTVVAWGNNDHGKLDIPSPNSGFIAIAAGSAHSLALKSDGSIVAWGWNEWGQCSVPAPNTNFVAIAAGLTCSMGLKTDGSIVVWGKDEYGILSVPPPNSNYGVNAWPEQLGLVVDGCRVIATNSVTLTRSQAATDLSRNAPVLKVQNCGVLRTPSLMNSLPMSILNNGLVEWTGVAWWTNSTRRLASPQAPEPGGALWVQGYAEFDEGYIAASVMNEPDDAVVSLFELTNRVNLVGGTTIGLGSPTVAGRLIVQGDATGFVATVVNSEMVTNGDRWEASVALSVTGATIATGADFDFSGGLILTGDARLGLDITATGYQDGTNGGLIQNTMDLTRLGMDAGASITLGSNAANRITVRLGEATEFAGRLREIVDTRTNPATRTVRHAYGVTQGGAGLTLSQGDIILGSADGLAITGLVYDIETDLETGLTESLAKIQLDDGSVLEVYKDTTGQLLPQFHPGPGSSVLLDTQVSGGKMVITIREKLGDLIISRYETGFNATYGTGDSLSNTVTFSNTGTVNALEYAISNASPWLVITPTNGTLAAMNAHAITLTAHTLSLTAGYYQAQATVTSPQAPGHQTHLTVTLTVARATQEITQFSPVSQSTLAVGQPVTFSAMGGASGNAVVFTNLNGSGTWMASNQFVPAATGPLLITASQQGNENYFSAVTLTNIYQIIRASSSLDWLMLLMEP